MRYRLATLMLVMVLSSIGLLAAPVPARPYAVLDIGPPPKGQTAEAYHNWYVETLPHICAYHLRNDAEIKRLSSAPRSRVSGLLREENLQIQSEGGGRRLRLTFVAGGRDEQVVILNAVLHTDLRLNAQRAEWHEEGIRSTEALERLAVKCLKDERNRDMIKHYQKALEDSKVRKAEVRDEIARLKSIDVIRWAK